LYSYEIIQRRKEIFIKVDPQIAEKKMVFSNRLNYRKLIRNLKKSFIGANYYDNPKNFLHIEKPLAFFNSVLYKITPAFFPSL